MFNKSIEEVSKLLETSIDKGLTSEQVASNQEKYGKNSLKEGK